MGSTKGYGALASPRSSETPPCLVLRHEWCASDAERVAGPDRQRMMPSAAREPLAARRVMGARPASKAGPSKEAPWGRKTGPSEGGGSPHALPCHALFTHALAVWLASGELDLYGLAHHQFFYGHSAACAVLHCLHPFPHSHGAPEVGGVDSTRVPGDASEVAANIQLVLRCEARFSLVAVSLSRLAVSFQVT